MGRALPRSGDGRDLVKTGRWSADLGREFSFCLDVRGVGDYGSEVRVDASQAKEPFVGDSIEVIGGPLLGKQEEA